MSDVHRTPQAKALMTKGTEPAPGVLIGPSHRVLADAYTETAATGDRVMVAVEPTQVRRPWRATARTAFQALVAFAVLFPVLVETAGLDPESFPWIAVPVGVAAAFARVMALPQVEAFLRRFVPFLAAAK